MMKPNSPVIKRESTVFAVSSRESTEPKPSAFCSQSAAEVSRAFQSESFSAGIWTLMCRRVSAALMSVTKFAEVQQRIRHDRERVLDLRHDDVEEKRDKARDEQQREQNGQAPGRTLPVDGIAFRQGIEHPPLKKADDRVHDEGEAKADDDGQRTSKMPTIAPRTFPMCIRNRQKVIVKHRMKMIFLVFLRLSSMRTVLASEA